MKNKFIKILNFYKQFGFGFSTKYFYYKITKNDKKYIQHIYNYLIQDNNDIILKYNNYNIFENENTQQKRKNRIPVWVCWWQGYEKMPALCKMFYNRLKEMLPENAELILITLDNYLDYASIPDVIRKKFEKGQITMTTYSDVLRNYLLRDNGGLWIDSSVFVSNYITKDFLSDKNWWSINLFEKNTKIENLGQKISERRWSGFLQKGVKNNILNSYLCDSFLHYYEKHDCTIDYFIQNFYIKIAYLNNPSIKKMIDSIPYNNWNVYSLYDNIDKSFDLELYNKWRSNTCFYKMTQKREYKLYDANNQITFYGMIKKICENKEVINYDKK
ncbi:capsular polysaccharide synthesis protein [Kandleria vitulina]|uniref:capsular polysaccharide synthesis protein n=1 Tax=Kandleria vitulina TaxID=1630 RepID=UPI00094540FA|nr:capsular polysaccharide synthesis protein [Kandleria vitulina]